MKNLKKIPIIGFTVPAISEPVLIKDVLPVQSIGYHDYAFRALGDYAPATQGGSVNCHEVTEPMMHYDRIVSEAAGIDFSGKCAQARHALMIGNELTWALPQVIHIMNQHIANPKLGLLSQEPTEDGECALNFFPVHCCGRELVCIATIQFDLDRKKFGLFCHELTNPGEVYPGSRIFVRVS